MRKERKEKRKEEKQKEKEKREKFTYRGASIERHQIFQHQSWYLKHSRTISLILRIKYFESMAMPP